jgi:hypothetical protein
MYFGSKLKLFRVFQDESGTSENENFKMRESTHRRKMKERRQWMSLVDLVSNHDGSGRISPCGACSWPSEDRPHSKNSILKFFTDSVVPDAIWNLEQF